MLSGDLAVLQRYVQQHGALDGADNVFGFDRSDPRYAKEEILVETAAITRTESIARPRIAAERKYGNVTKTNVSATTRPYAARLDAWS